MSEFFEIVSSEPEDTGPAFYTVMIVDDSAFIRGAIARAIESDPDLFIVNSVSNGEQAISTLRRDPVDVIVLDIEMPIMDGLTALPKLKEIDGAVQIIMASTLTQKNAEISLKAMSLGATDYIPKPSSGHAVSGSDAFRHDLVLKIKALGALARRSGVRMPNLSKITQMKAAKTAPDKQAEIKRFPSQPPTARPKIPTLPKTDKNAIVLRSAPLFTPEIIAIGSSTGGPQALFKVIKDMGNNLPQPIVITQHMPPSFTSILAEHITKQCGVTCTEAKDGDILQAGHYYIAPGDFHMHLTGPKNALTVSLSKDPPENFCRPSVDPMLRSLSKIAGLKVFVVILTGMGMDGTLGSKEITNTGGAVIAQNEATSIVWGMPGSVAMAGLCSAILSLDEIGGYIRRTATRTIK